VAVKLQPRGRTDERAGVAPSRVAVVRGAKSREKLVEVRGVEAAALPGLLAG